MVEDGNLSHSLERCSRIEINVEQGAKCRMTRLLSKNDALLPLQVNIAQSPAVKMQKKFTIHCEQGTFFVWIVWYEIGRGFAATRWHSVGDKQTFIGARVKLKDNWGEYMHRI